jgi:hypothetical protein
LLPTISPCAITNPRALQHVTQCQDLHLTAPPPTATAATGTAGLPNQMVALMANQNQIIQQQQQQTQLTSTQNQKGFRRLPGHLRRTWLQASSRTHKDAVDANGDACGGQVRTIPTTGSQELFDAATNSLAKQQLQFDIQRKYAIQIEISDGAVAALREGLILNIGAGRLGAVNLFSVGEEDISSAIQSSSRDVTDFLELHIARTDGMGLSESQVKKAAKVHYHVPTNVDEGQRQLIGSAALLGHLFDQDNSTSAIKSFLANFIAHIEKYKQSYMLLQFRDRAFMMAVLVRINAHIQAYIQSCSSTPAGQQADARTLDMAEIDIQNQVMFGTFVSPAMPPTLYNAFMSKIQKETGLRLPPPPPYTTPIPPGQTNQNKKRPNDATHPRRQRGAPATNLAIKEQYAAKARQNWPKFLKASYSQTIPTVAGETICLNFHVKGSCDSLCDRAKTHQTLDTAMYNLLWEATIAALASM